LYSNGLSSRCDGLKGILIIAFYIMHILLRPQYFSFKHTFYGFVFLFYQETT